MIVPPLPNTEAPVLEQWVDALTEVFTLPAPHSHYATLRLTLTVPHSHSVSLSLRRTLTPPHSQRQCDRYLDYVSLQAAAVRTLIANDASFFTGSDDHTVKHWEMSTGECIWAFEGHTGSVNCLVRTRTEIITGSADGTTLSALCALASNVLRLCQSYLFTYLCVPRRVFLCLTREQLVHTQHCRRGAAART